MSAPTETQTGSERLLNCSEGPPLPLFTIFTSTFNRAHTLHRVFESLKAQTLRDFEWLVVDDGSTDNTSELITDWAKTADFPIRYFKQPNSGKHIAYNLAAHGARGQFFLPLDSDDACVPRTLERIAFHWNTIPAEDRPFFCAIAGLSINQNGKIVGDRFPSDPFDANLRDQKYVYRLRGEKCCACLTEIVRRFPFPEIADTKFVPEGVVGLHIAKMYKIRGVNEIFRIYYVDDEKTGATLTKRKSLGDNAAGRLHYYVWLLNNDLNYFWHAPTPFLKAAVMLPVVTWFLGRSLRAVLGLLEKPSAKAMILLALPFALVFYAVDRVTSSSNR